MTDTQKPDTIDEALYDYGTDFISHPASRSIGDIEEAGTIMLAARNSFLRLQAENEALREALAEAADDIEAWGAYASEYFQKKHNLQGDIDAARAAVAETAAECTRSHPHEEMDGYCELRTQIARLTNKNEALRAALAETAEPDVPETDFGNSQQPVLYIHPATFAMASAHVGAWKPGHELEGYIPLYAAPQAPAPAVSCDCDRLLAALRVAEESVGDMNALEVARAAIAAHEARKGGGV